MQPNASDAEHHGAGVDKRPKSAAKKAARKAKKERRRLKEAEQEAGAPEGDKPESGDEETSD